MQAALHFRLFANRSTSVGIDDVHHNCREQQTQRQASSQGAFYVGGRVRSHVLVGRNSQLQMSHRHVNRQA